MFSLSASKVPVKTTLAETKSSVSRQLSSALSPPYPAPPPPSTPSDESKDEIESEGFRLLGIRSSEIPDSPSYSVTAKRALLAASLGGSGFGLVPLKSNERGSQSYRLRIVTAGAVTPTAGVAASSFLVDPSNIPLSQWSSFAALFDEVRVRAFTVTITPYSNGSTSSGTNSRVTSCAMGSFYSKTSLPSNIISVLDADDATLVSPLMVKPHTHHMRVPKVLGFAPTSSPGGDTYRGCPGSVQLYATGDGTNSMFTYFVCGIYQLRGRV